MATDAFDLEVSGLHWLEGAPAERDLCVHGAAYVRLGDQTLVTPADGDGWTLSAASLYLLRAMTRDHTEVSRVGEHLIPCCGSSMWRGDNGTVVVVGCANGIDWSVRHVASGVRLDSRDDNRVLVSREAWREAILRVADQVRGFYDASDAKRVPDDEEVRAGYEAFWSEWQRLRDAAGRGSGA